VTFQGVAFFSPSPPGDSCSDLPSDFSSRSPRGARTPYLPSPPYAKTEECRLTRVVWSQFSCPDLLCSTLRGAVESFLLPSDCVNFFRWRCHVCRCRLVSICFFCNWGRPESLFPFLSRFLEIFLQPPAPLPTARRSSLPRRIISIYLNVPFPLLSSFFRTIDLLLRFKNTILAPLLRLFMPLLLFYLLGSRNRSLYCLFFSPLLKTSLPFQSSRIALPDRLVFSQRRF